MRAPPSSSASTICPMAALTSEGPAKYRPLPSVIKILSHKTGKYAPPATQLPMMAANCGIPAAEMTELFRKMRPKSSSSGKISSCIGRNTPAESTR
jgi:hypothetical protein